MPSNPSNSNSASRNPASSGSNSRGQSQSQSANKTIKDGGWSGYNNFCQSHGIKPDDHEGYRAQIEAYQEADRAASGKKE